MKNLKRTLTVFLLYLLATTVMKASYESLKVGETKTFKLPTNVTILSNLKVTSWVYPSNNDYIKCSHSYGTSIKVTGVVIPQIQFISHVIMNIPVPWGKKIMANISSKF